MLAQNVSLGAMRLQAQQRANLEGSNQIVTSEWNQYISQSYKRLYDMLIAAYGNEYFVAPLFQFTVGSSQYYPLPDGTLTTIGGTSPAPALYKLIGVDLQYSGAPNGWVTMERFEEIQRNQFAWPNTAVNLLGITNLKYRISGTNIEFIPVPMSGQVVQLKYIPVPTSLQFMPTCSITNTSTAVTTTDTGDLAVGMNVYGTGIPSGATISAIGSATAFTLSAAATATNTTAILSCWTDAVTFNGISGWEEYVIIDAAIKALVKQQQPVEDLSLQKAQMVKDIESMAEGRDVGQACHVSDVLGISSFGSGGYGGMGGGFDGFGGSF